MLLVIFVFLFVIKFLNFYLLICYYTYCILFNNLKMENKSSTSNERTIFMQNKVYLDDLKNMVEVNTIY